MARLSPSNEPRASDRHHGAARPASAGTKSTPSLSARARRRPASRASASRPRSHEPPDGRRRREHLAVDAVRACPRACARRPTWSARGATGVPRHPCCASRNAPVPYVHLAAPGVEAALREQRGLLVDDEAAERAAAPPKADRRRRRPRRTRPVAAGARPARPNSASSSLVPGDRRRGPGRSERLAVVTSVTNSPVSWCTQPGVGRGDDAVAWSTCRRSQAIFGAREVRDRAPARCAGRSGRPASRSSAQTDSARPSCHTSAGSSGSPESRIPGQDGLALVRQGHGVDPTPAAAERPPSGGRAREASSSAGSCSTPPSGEVLRDAPAPPPARAPRRRRRRRSAFVPDVPWSIARTVTRPNLVTRAAARCRTRSDRRRSRTARCASRPG